MDDLCSPRYVRLRLESLEDRLVPSLAPVFSDEGAANAAYVNATSNLTTPVVGVAADNSFDVAWVYTDPSTGLGEIYARQFNSDGTAKGASFLVASSTVNESQPAIAVASDGTFIIAYTKAVSPGADDVFFQVYAANGSVICGETAAPSGADGGTLDDFSPTVAVCNATDQFIIAWEQQTSATNSTIWASAFSAGGAPLTNADVGVATTAGLASDPQVAIEQTSSSSVLGTFGSVISYTLNYNGEQQVYFRRYYSLLSEIDTGLVGVPVEDPDATNEGQPPILPLTGTLTTPTSSAIPTDIESQASIAIDPNGDLLVAWTSQPLSGGPTQILYQEYNSGNQPLFTFFQQYDTTIDTALPSPGAVDSNSSLNETAPQVAINSDGQFLVAFVGTPVSGGSGQIYYQEFSAPGAPVGSSVGFSSETNASNKSPSLATSGNDYFVIAADNLTTGNPNAIVRGFDYLADHVGVIQQTASGLAQFVLDSNGNNAYDANDTTFTFGYYTDQFVIGDWNGAGYDEVGVVRPYEGVASIWSLDTNGDGVFDAGDQVFIYGLATDTFVIGDWNGAGKDEIGVVRQSSGGLEWVLNTSGSGLYSPGSSAVDFYGLDTDTPVVGDWTGDGKDEIGVVRTTASGQLEWILNTTGSGSFSSSDAVYYFGSAGDIPVVGDWTGSGKTEIGVIEPQSNGTALWVLDTNGDGVMDAGDETFTYGLATDKFIIGEWKPTALPQYAAQPGPGGVTPLTNVQLAATVQLAINDWAAAGLDPQQINQLENVHFQIAQLPNNLIGLTEGNTIDISSTADGWGWSLGAGQPASNRMDLLTTVSHELGHILGLPDTSNLDDVMGNTLTPGTQHLPTAQDVDAVFAQMGTANG